VLQKLTLRKSLSSTGYNTELSQYVHVLIIITAIIC
jgi:hypothetical protein